jgi:hypothetical protein
MAEDIQFSNRIKKEQEFVQPIFFPIFVMVYKFIIEMGFVTIGDDENR